MTKEQLDLFSYDLTFIKMLRDQVFRGEIRELGANATLVLIVLRACVPIDGTSAHPTIETIEELSGLGKKAIRSSLDILKKKKYVEVVKSGRKNIYRLLEKVYLESNLPQKNEDQIATMPYGAIETRKHYSHLAEYAKSGELDHSSPIIIHNLDLTINYNASGGSAVFINAKELDQIPKGRYREAVERILGMVPGQIEASADANGLVKVPKKKKNQSS